MRATPTRSEGDCTALVVDVVIPALDEEQALPGVLAEIPSYIRAVVVADNGSTDATGRVAREAGATVVVEPRRGYGAACLKALLHLRPNPPEIVVFLDGDGSDVPAEMERLLAAIEAGADFVVGSRSRGGAEEGSLTSAQRIGNWVACQWIRWATGAQFSDLGPFRAIRWEALERLAMSDPNWGWTVEMQLAAAQASLRCVEVPVSYRVRRAGRSKVSGTIRGSIAAGTKILWVLARHTLRRIRVEPEHIRRDAAEESAERRPTSP